MSAVNFTGSYTLARSENFDAFLQANGANWMIRKMIKSVKPTIKIHQDGDNFEIVFSTMVMTRESKFTVGVAFEEKQHSGDIMKCLATWEGDKLVMTLEPKAGGQEKSQKHTREINGDEYIVTMETGDVVARQFFKRNK